MVCLWFHFVTTMIYYGLAMVRNHADRLYEKVRMRIGSDLELNARYAHDPHEKRRMENRSRTVAVQLVKRFFGYDHYLDTC